MRSTSSARPAKPSAPHATALGTARTATPSPRRSKPYQTLHANELPSADAIAARLTHVVDYLATLPNPAVTVEQVDEGWIRRFRAWAVRQPIVSSKGKERQRSRGTVEN